MNRDQTARGRAPSSAAAAGAPMKRDNQPRPLRPASRKLANFENSPARVKVYAFILAQPAFPDHEAIGHHMGWRNTSSVTGVLMYLYGAGYVNRVKTGRVFSYSIPAEARKDFEDWQRKNGKAA